MEGAIQHRNAGLDHDIDDHDDDDVGDGDKIDLDGDNNQLWPVSAAYEGAPYAAAGAPYLEAVFR